MKKIFFYINTLGHGGAERVMVNLARAFAEKDNECTLITSCRIVDEYPLAQNVRRISLEEQKIEQSRLKRNISRIAKLRKICKEEKPDILISFMAEPNFRAIIATRGLPVKTLVSVRNDPNKEYAGKVGWFVGKVLLPMADGCVFQTSDAQKWFSERLKKKSRIIYNTVKEEFYQIERTPVHGEIVTCGRLTEQKNHDLLIRAFAQVQKKHPEAVLKIYGEGALRDTLQAKIKELDLQGKAFLMGATNDVASVLKTADVFVLSSDYEGMPNALMEAMAAGVPCISTDCPCGGPRELFAADAAQKLVPCNDAAKLADMICRMLEKADSGTLEKKHAEVFRPERVNAVWEEYMMKIIGK